MVFFYAFFSLGVVAGSLLSGIVSQYLGMPFIFSAVIMIICGVILLVIAKFHQHEINVQ